MTTPHTTSASVPISNANHRPVHGEVVHYTVPDVNHGAMTTIPAVPYGSSPSGSMVIYLSSKPCPGFTNTTSPNQPTIKLCYDLLGGIQSAYFHDNPGVAYHGTTWVAYLPNDMDGNLLLTRFKLAFYYGHMFSIGKSIATGLDNQITWSIIPNKTSLNGGGPFGFPDSFYITNANAALDNLGIPSSNACFLLLKTLLQSQVPPSGYIPPTNPNNHWNQNSQVPPPGYILPTNPNNHWNQNSSNVIVIQTESSMVEIISYVAPKSLSSNCAVSLDGILEPIDTNEVHDVTASSQACVLCLEPLLLTITDTGNVCKIGMCKHRFHADCIKVALEHHPKCPTCRLPAGNPQGKSPSGTMAIKLDPDQDCPGFSDANGTYEISYRIPAGIQESYHENPGVRYSGAHRIAYLPNNEAGRNLLLRLKYAWKHGLIFRIGTSLTNGLHNQVTWTSIHHKTHLNFSPSYHVPHSFPDDSYILNCNESLDALHVPSPENCH